jgi:hypothetical protein
VRAALTPDLAILLPAALPMLAVLAIEIPVKKFRAERRDWELRSRGPDVRLVGIRNASRRWTRGGRVAYPPAFRMIDEVAQRALEARPCRRLLVPEERVLFDLATDPMERTPALQVLGDLEEASLE